ncbi:hypothetical protein MLD38_005552 [Melastoma candidum]|uniref:Uncharacterized protein n=1 Tax=Melastoma candidum TaxID=119954 RepID=A0ACB9RJS1_9MYRT|nr:hypothetical protein MLD38_005552 [Melastoma candidum]
MESVPPRCMRRKADQKAIMLSSTTGFSPLWALEINPKAKIAAQSDKMKADQTSRMTTLLDLLQQRGVVRARSNCRDRLSNMKPRMFHVLHKLC